MLRDRGPVSQVVDYGCGLGYYLDTLVRGLGAQRGQGFDISETAVLKARNLFPDCNFQQADLTVTNNPLLKVNSDESGSAVLHVIRGTLWYVFPKLEAVVGNLVAKLSPADALVVIQNFPPLDSDFVGKEVIPNPDALIGHFTAQSVILESSIWYEKCQGHSNDSWFIGVFKRSI